MRFINIYFNIKIEKNTSKSFDNLKFEMQLLTRPEKYFFIQEFYVATFNKSEEYKTLNYDQMIHEKLVFHFEYYFSFFQKKIINHFYENIFLKLN